MNRKVQLVRNRIAQINGLITEADDRTKREEAAYTAYLISDTIRHMPRAQAISGTKRSYDWDRIVRMLDEILELVQK